MGETIAEERRALADDLSGLTDEQWGTPSWCEGWTVEDVVAHLTGTASTTPASFFVGLARNGFSFDRFVASTMAAHKGSTPAETLGWFRAVEASHKAPPGPRASWLGEVLVHGEDVRRPLGLRREHPVETVRTVADFYKGSDMIIGAKSRVAGLHLRATDTDWEHGEGALVEGPLLPIVLAMTGRGGACEDLHGEGVAELRSRC